MLAWTDAFCSDACEKMISQHYSKQEETVCDLLVFTRGDDFRKLVGDYYCWGSDLF